MNTRKARDSLGTVNVPEAAYYGAHTKRAAENFPISGLTFPLEYMRVLALIKKCAAEANLNLGLLKQKMTSAIGQAAQEVMDGKFNDQFIVDIFQTGSGTSFNMNMNEVIATRANEIITGNKHANNPVHPNDHVNKGQSSNDVIPTAMHVVSLDMVLNRLIPSLKKLKEGLDQKAAEFDSVLKVGRTHLQDAVPITLGEEFSGYARQVELGIERIFDTGKRLEELALGGTAVGTGLNTHPDFAGMVISMISEHMKIEFKEAENRFEAQAAKDTIVEMSGQLKTLTVSLAKIANDIRWLSSGPTCGLGEINLPALQPGSSIMPGKVNPVIPEAVLQAAAQVIGNDTAITVAGQSGNFELNVMMPVMAYNLHQSITLLANASEVFNEKCVAGITANAEKCASNVDKSLALATFLVPYIGYDDAARIVKTAVDENRNIEDVVREQGLLPEQTIDKIFRKQW